MSPWDQLSNALVTGGSAILFLALFRPQRGPAVEWTIIGGITAVAVALAIRTL